MLVLPDNVTQLLHKIAPINAAVHQCRSLRICKEALNENGPRKNCASTLFKNIVFRSRNGAREDAIVDTIGCMMAGMNDAAPQSVAAAFRDEITRDGTSLVFTGGRASRSVAALINGTAPHCLDFDDNFHPARAHASAAVLVPALLSIATSSEDFQVICWSEPIWLGWKRSHPWASAPPLAL